jgi:hypothetical protein
MPMPLGTAAHVATDAIDQVRRAMVDDARWPHIRCDFADGTEVQCCEPLGLLACSR